MRGANALLFVYLVVTRALASAVRLDAALVSQGLCTSRAHAKSAIQAGHVSVDGMVVHKAALPVDADSVQLQVGSSAETRYVSRAGEKLRAALETFDVDVSGVHVLDIGASTGGFTDCLLDRGAASATCVDCGHGQLHPRLAAHPRLLASLEGTNARFLSAADLPRKSFGVIVVDVSFISLTLVLPALWSLLERDTAHARLVALVKPQFEAVSLLGKTGRDALNRGKGVLQDGGLQHRVLDGVADFARSQLDDCAVVASMESPLRGGDGNREFLLSLAFASHQLVHGPFVQASTSLREPSLPEPSVEGGVEIAESEGVTTPVRASRKKASAASRAAAYAKKKEANSLKKLGERSS